MPCNAVATARARVGNLAQVIGGDPAKTEEVVRQLCRVKFPREDFYLQIRGEDVIVSYSSIGQVIASYAKQVIGALAQRAIAAKVAKAARVTGQTTAMNGALVLEVEL